jgi:hypothetical protein
MFKPMPRRLAAILFLTILGLVLSGCDDASPTDPGTTADTAPVLPDPGQLTIDLGFFDGADEAGKAFGRQNFFNAYLRAVIVTSVTELVLAPPVAAFALALHTVPSHQQDGSWIWVYTFVDGDEEAQVRLRGRDQGDHVDWSMRATVPAEGLDDVLWFDGTTRDDGTTGAWTFYDAGAAAADLTWDHVGAVETLSLQALAGEDAGDAITFTVDGPRHRIDFVEGDTDAVWFVRWNETTGAGSLQVPDYRGGAESCWDEDQYDVDCG